MSYNEDEHQQLFRLPSRPPTPGDVEDRERFRRLANSSLPEVRAAAEKWRTGLAALVTIVTAGLLIKGPEAAHELTPRWRLVLTILAGGGIALTIYGLWQALKAAAGSPQSQHLQAIVDRYGSVLVYELALAKRASDELRRARAAVMIALPLLGAALIAWWWSDTTPHTPPAFIAIDRGAAASICGELTSADNGRIRVQVAGEERPRAIPLGQITNLRVKESC
jgi:hypothetical protein